MTAPKKKSKTKVHLDMSFDEAVQRFIETDPKELAEALAADVIKKNERAKNRIEAARKEIEEGGRPRRRRTAS